MYAKTILATFQGTVSQTLGFLVIIISCWNSSYVHLASDL